MKTSLHWVNQYLDRPATAGELADCLPQVGFPIDASEEVVTAHGQHDTRLEVEVTSNRSDCLSHVGVARELAAATGRTLKLPDCTLPAAAREKVEAITSVACSESKLCPLYTARVIRGVKVGPSPVWLTDRLESVGLRSVNNVVDVTNYVLMELGQPLHAFDLAKLRGRRIVVRRAAAGEGFTAIDNSKHTLRDSMLVIADAERPVAVAGVMGGLDSEVGDSTVDVLLESAMFDPLNVRRTSRALKLSSDSSFRFERGVDPIGVETASRRAAKLIIELAGGTLAEGVIRVGIEPPTPRTIDLRVSRCNSLLGVALSPQQIIALLDRLALSPLPLREGPGEGRSGDTTGTQAMTPAQPSPNPSLGGRGVQDTIIRCTIPTFRLDLEREVDLIEEVARQFGLNQIPTRQKIELEVRPVQPDRVARRKLREVLIAHGYHETATFSFVATKLGEPFLPTGGEGVLVPHDRRKAEPMLRPSLLPSLLTCRKTNQDVGNHGVRFFETASTWSRQGGKVVEIAKLALMADAEGAASVNDAAALGQGLRGLRGSLEELAAALGGPRGVLTFEPTTADRFAAAADVSLNGQIIGQVGVLSEAVQKLFDLQAPVLIAELELPALLALYPPQRQAGALPRFPGIERDLSVIVADEVRWQQIESEVRTAGPAMLESLAFIDTYRGKPIPQGRKSVTLRMMFRDAAGTLRHDQVDPQVNAVVSRLKSSLNAELRA